MSKLIHFFQMILYENGEASLTRVLSIGSWLVFIVISIYMIICQITWSHYETFALLTGGGGAATQVVNKFVNGKYNSMPGTYEQAAIVKTRADR